MTALDRRHKELLEQDKNLFSKREQLMSMWQEIAENFYPERADFTITRTIGDTFAGALDTSYPILARRDLGNAFSAMLRPAQKVWSHMRKKGAGDDEPPEDERQWTEMADKTLRRAMYDRESGFVRATKESDNDFAAFGQAVLSSELATTPTSGQILLHRNHHLRDMAWMEDTWGRIGQRHRKWEPTARQLVHHFPGKISDTAVQLSEKEPFKTVQIRHCVIPTHEYEADFQNPWVSVYIEMENENLIEEVGINTPHYIIPRWQTVSGSQYAYSPATVAALPDARLIQAMTYTLLTAGEKAVDPPLIGVSEAIKGGIEAYPGGFTAVDATYDERLGEVVRPLSMGGEKSIPLGLEMTQDTRAMIAEAFFLNKLTLPDTSGAEMTAFEVARRIEEFIRGALPLFEPMEYEYNGAMLEQNFAIMMRGGAFGPIDNVPESLREAVTSNRIEFMFESPLHDAIERMKAQQLVEAKQLIVEVEPLDPLAVKMLDWRTALRDALHGISISAKWLIDDDQMDNLAQEQASAEQAAKVLESVSAGAQVAEQIGKAGQALNPEGAPTGEPVI